MLKITEPCLLFLKEACEVDFKTYFGENYLYIQQQPEYNSKLSTDSLEVLQSKTAKFRAFHGFFSCAENMFKSIQG